MKLVSLPNLLEISIPLTTSNYFCIPSFKDNEKIKEFENFIISKSNFIKKNNNEFIWKENLSNVTYKNLDNLQINYFINNFNIKKNITNLDFNNIYNFIEQKIPSFIEINFNKINYHLSPFKGKTGKLKKKTIMIIFRI